MDTIVGLGRAGCAIADKFSSYPQYKVFKIDSEGIEKKSKNCYLLPRHGDPEEYEKSVRSMKTFFKGATQDVLFVLSGSGLVSGAALQILKSLQGRNINILYIKPDIEFLGHVNILQERTVRNVLQEYTRSGIFERMFLIDNIKVEEVIGEVPIVGYYDKLNELIVSTIHMINVYNNNKPVIENSAEPREHTRISTIGVSNLDNDPNAILRTVYDSLYEALKPSSIPQAVLIIAKYQYQSAFVADQEINLLAALTEIMVECEFK